MGQPNTSMTKFPVFPELTKDEKKKFEKVSKPTIEYDICITAKSIDDMNDILKMFQPGKYKILSKVGTTFCGNKIS